MFKRIRKVIYMNISSYETVTESELLGKVFPFLVERGLENITIRELCKGTGLVQGSLYYWFGDKTTIVCEATEYGLKKVTDEIFRYVFSSLDHLRDFFDGCLDEVEKYTKELRFVYQMAASPLYGEQIRSTGNNFNAIYDAYIRKLAERLNYDQQRLRPLVYLFISDVLDYVIWQEREKSQMQLEFIYSVLHDAVCSQEKGLKSDR